MLRLEQIWDDAEDLLRAELYREIGEFGQATKILDALTIDNPFIQYLVSQIRQLAESRQTYAFQIKYVPTSLPTKKVARKVEQQTTASSKPDQSAEQEYEDLPF